MKKKILSLVIAMMMVTGAFAMYASADTTFDASTLPTIGVTDLVATDNYAEIIYDADDDDGDGIATNPNQDPYGPWNAGTDTTKIKYISDSDVTWIASGNTNCSSGCNCYDQPTESHRRQSGRNAAYKGVTDSGLKVAGQNKLTYTKGVGMHPNGLVDSGNYSYTVIDVEAYTDANGTYGYNTFYALVGFTGAPVINQGIVPQITFLVYGDKGDGAGFVKLASSNALDDSSRFGEFNVDITGVKTLGLFVIAENSNTGCACAFANACIYKADETAVKPDYSIEVGGDGEGELVDPNAGSSSSSNNKTDNKKETAKAEDTTEATDAEVVEAGGCGSSIGAGLAIVGTVAACGVFATGKKRKED